MRCPRIILVLAVIVFAQCVSGFAQTLEDTGKPRLITQFRDKDREWYKITVELLRGELSKDPGRKAVVRVRFDKGLRMRIQLLRKGAAFLKLDQKRVTYFIVNSQDYDTESYIADTCNDIPTCDSCVVIRASDFDGLDKLFRLRRIARRN